MSNKFISSAFDNSDVDSTMGRMLGNSPAARVGPKCEGCNQTIADKFITLPSGKKYHPQCAPDSGRCDRCNKPILGRMVNTLGKNYHSACWTCTSCNSELETNFVQIYDQPFCLRCEQKVRQSDGEIKVAGGRTTISRYTTKENKREEEKSQMKNELFQNIQAGKESCKWCRKVIAGETVPHKNAFYHRECFMCAICANPIGDEGFTEKDDLVYCKGCFADSNAGGSNKLCEACQQDVAGTYVQAGGKLYHQSCFLCGRCRGSLAAGYVLKDGKPLCGNCAGKAQTVSMTTHSYGGEKKAGISVDPRSGKVIRK